MGLFDWLGGKKEAPNPPGAWKPAVKAEVAKPAIKQVALEDLRPEILALVRPAWKPIVATEEGAPGGSRFGGRPGLAAGEHWPKCGGCQKPMPFFLQMNLAEAPGSFGTGLLQFFCCINTDSNCSTYEAFTNGQRVRIVDPAQVSFPSESATLELFPARRVTGWTELKDIPNWEEIREQKVELSDEDERSMEDLNLPHTGDKLGGWPAWVQNVEYPKCPACGSAMRLVFQLDSEDNVPYMWGDVGCGHITQCPNHPNVLGYGWACC